MFKKYTKSESGNMAMMFALMLGILGIALAAAVDGANMLSTKTKASAIADAAALAGASASESDYENRLNVVQSYIAANAYKLGENVMLGEAIITFDDENEVVTVEFPTTLNLAFGSFVGASTKPVVAVSQASYLKNNVDPVTIVFALDVSGSMGANTSDGRTKIAVLKSSIVSLFDAIENGSDNPRKVKEAIRTGLSAYNTELVDSQTVAYGWNHLESSVQALLAAGGTNSTPALSNSYNQLKNDRAFRKANESGFELESLKEYVIFMTDGDNNDPNFDVTSGELCMEMKSEGVEIYSVAFEAPEKGELLLVNCASPNEGIEDTGKDASKCMNAGQNGNGNALGHCADKDTRTDHYFDANDAVEFKAAFTQIGRDIVKSNVRLNR